MTDDIVTRLIPFIHNEMRIPAGLIMDIIDEIERLRAELKDADNDFHALKEMFDRMRVDRDLWKEVAENLASELGKKEYAHAEYDTCKEAAEGVA